MPQARTALLEHGRSAPVAIVLFHGLTNNPAQYARLAPMLYERDVNVLVPRLPTHGDRDRLTKAPASLTAEMLLSAAYEAVDIACGLGERVAVLGISMGALLAAYLAQFRAIALAVPVAPSFALLHLPHPVSRFVARVGLRLPNRFLWWDPRVRADEPPLTAYPRFSTRALMQSLRIGDAVYEASARQPPLAERIVTVVNRTDPAVNNHVAKRISAAWSAGDPGHVSYVELRGLPHVHDIIDPQQPLARTGEVYPKLFEALGVSNSR
ncbi:MAG TPA: alpha/beta fold hydrolase [Candidatus Babeliales bacterium]|nr:alpha/beta fold hydrolase [Candidatus Babeliales bacterium]